MPSKTSFNGPCVWPIHKKMHLVPSHSYCYGNVKRRHEEEGGLGDQGEREVIDSLIAASAKFRPTGKLEGIWLRHNKVERFPLLMFQYHNQLNEP